MISADLNLVAGFLARRDIGARQFQSANLELVILAGNAVLESLEVAANIAARNPRIPLLISGGIGHSTEFLREAVKRDPRYSNLDCAGLTEAEILQRLLIGYHGLARERFFLETQSTNCGNNATESRALLDRENLHPKGFVLIQDPTMQRRSHECFRRAWKETNVQIYSYSPIVPECREIKDGFVVSGWSSDRFLSLVLGEIRRLRDDGDGYGPRGKNFIDHVEIPTDVLASYERTVHHFQLNDRPAHSG